MFKVAERKKKYKIINICAFDSVIQAMATAYLHSKEYSNNIDTNALCKTSKLASHLVKEGANRKFYEECIIVLRDYCKRNQLIGELTELIHKLMLRSISISCLLTTLVFFNIIHVMILNVVSLW